MSEIKKKQPSNSEEIKDTKVGGKKKVTYDLSGFNIMLVDDYEFMQMIISQMLSAFGVGKVMSCTGGNEARELLKISLAGGGDSSIKPVDMILTDWMMPDGSGKSLIKWIRNHKKDEVRFLPIIVVSAFMSDKLTRAARDEGADEVLIKPVSGEILAARILNVIDNRRNFIKTSTFFGPDRRRKDQVYKGEERRIHKTEEIIIYNEKL
jgi:DNA-binding response OmpR family regulator